MSSRNERLTAAERKDAAIIYKTIFQAKKLFKTKSALAVTEFVTKSIAKQSNFELEYFQITLLPCARKSSTKKYRAFIAVFVNKIRLIDTNSLN